MSGGETNVAIVLSILLVVLGAALREIRSLWMLRKYIRVKGLAITLVSIWPKELHIRKLSKRSVSKGRGRGREVGLSISLVWYKRRKVGGKSTSLVLMVFQRVLRAIRTRPNGG